LPQFPELFEGIAVDQIQLGAIENLQFPQLLKAPECLLLHRAHCPIADQQSLEMVWPFRGDALQVEAHTVQLQIGNGMMAFANFGIIKYIFFDERTTRGI
jgi:hypothetical protein